MRVLVKIGGAQLEESGPRAEFARAVKAARDAGHELIVVHGGGAQIRALAEALGLEEQRVAGMRVTDDATAEVVLAVLGGTVGRQLARALEEAGVSAVSLTGADGASFSAHALELDGADLGWVGEIDSVRPGLIEHLLAGGYVPVVASVAPPETQRAGSPFFNVNADMAVVPLATALAADAVLFLTDVPGVRGADGALLAELDDQGAAAGRADGVFAGGMLPKVEAAVAAAAAVPGVVRISPADAVDFEGGAVLAALAGETGTLFRSSSPTTATATATQETPWTNT